MKKYFLVLIGIATLLTGCSVFNSGDSLSPKSKRALRNGNIYFAQQLLDKAQGFLEEVLVEYPNHLEANKKLADIKYFDAENNDRIAYQSYLEAYDKYKIVYNQLKDVERDDMSREERRWYKDTRKKLESINARILLLGNKEYEAYYEDGTGNLDDIKAKYYKLIELDPDNIEPYRFLTSILNNEKIALRQEETPDELEIGKIDNEMLYMFSQWVRIEPTNIDYRTQYAKQLFALKRYEEASAQFETLTEQDPYNFDHYDLYAATMEQLGDYQAAYDKMEEANALIPENVDILKSLIFYANKLVEANTDTEAENGSQPYIDAYYNYSKALIELEASPSNLMTFCNFLYKQEMFDDLLTYSEKWFVVDKKSKSAAQLAAFAAQKLKDTNKYQYYAKKYKELSN